MSGSTKKSGSKREYRSVNDFTGKRILFVSEYFYPRAAGGEIWSWDLCRELARRGHDVTVLTLRYDQRLKKEEIVEGVRILRPLSTTPQVGFRAKRLIQTRRLAGEVKRRIKAGKPDLIHVMAYGLNVQVSKLAAKHHIPCITSVHSYFGKDWSSLFIGSQLHRVAEWLNLRSDRSLLITVPSRYLQRRIRQEAGRETVVMHNWLPERFPPPKDLPRNTLLFVGSLEPVKNPLACIPVARELGVPLIVIGDGSLRKKLDREAAQAGVECTIMPDLTREDTLAYLGGASLLLVPSITESFSLAALEAVAQGTPVSGTPVGVLPELPGVVPFPPTTLPPRLTLTQQAVVRKRFSKEKAVDAAEELYRRAVAHRNP